MIKIIIAIKRDQAGSAKAEVAWEDKDINEKELSGLVNFEETLHKPTSDLWICMQRLLRHHSRDKTDPSSN